MKSWVMIACLGMLAGCGGSTTESLVDTPVDMNEGAVALIFHRPQPVGTRTRVQGVYMSQRKLVAMDSGYVLNQENEHAQLSYDVTKTLTSVDTTGYPKVVRYDVAFLESTDADVAPIMALDQGRIVRLQGPGETSTFRSGGQQLEMRRTEGVRDVHPLVGTLTKLERRVLNDRFGPAYEMGLEATLAKMLKPPGPQREGSEWDVDLERATDMLTALGDLEAPTKLTGKAKFERLEESEGVPCYRVSAVLRGEGRLHTEITYRILSNNHAVELHYTGLFPVDLALPPVSHDWKFKAKARFVVEVNDVLGDTLAEWGFSHQSRVIEVRR